MNFFNKKTTQSLAEASSIRRWQAVIEFDLDATILEANDLFLKTVGYERAEVVGKHHSIFVPPEERASVAYQGFWRNLRSGKAFQAEFARVTKLGDDPGGDRAHGKDQGRRHVLSHDRPALE